jgi:type II secretory pathway component PulM
MFSWADKYSAREKLIVVSGLLVGLLLAGHAFIVEPYQIRIDDIRSNLDQKSSDLVWMQSVVPRLSKSGQVESVEKIDGSLANYIDQRVRKLGLSEQLSQMTPVGNDEIRLRYSAVDFNRMIDFVAQMNASGLEITDMRISNLDQPGKVDSSIVVVRK